MGVREGRFPGLWEYSNKIYFIILVFNK